MTRLLAVWNARIVLAAWLLLGAEVLQWTAPTRALADWPPLVAGYLALAALALDLAQRWRARDIFGLLLLSGLTAAAGSAVLFPQRALADFPLTLVTRTMGAYALTLALVLALALALSGTLRRPILGASAAAGVTWGVWAGGLSSLVSDAPSASLSPLLLTGAAALVVIGASRWLATRTWAGISTDNLRLSWASGAFALGAFVWNLTRAVDSAALPPLPLAACAALAAYCALLLWFQRRGRAPTPLDRALPPVAVRWLHLAGVAALFLAGGAAGFLLSQTPASSALSGLLALAYAAYGLVWLPTVSLVLGVQGWRRLTRQRRL